MTASSVISAITSGTLIFPPGTGSQAFTVLILGDQLDDGNRTVNLSLDNALSASLGLANATLMIVDDDGPQHNIYLPLVIRS